VRQPAAGLLDQLRRRRVVVRPPVSRIVVLIRVEVEPRALFEHLFDADDRTVGSLHGIGKDDFGPECFEDSLALGRHVLGYAKPDAIALGRTNHRVSNTGIPGGCVQDDLVAGKRPRPLSFRNHSGCRPILDRTTGILPFGLGVELDIAKAVFKARQADQGRIANQINDGRGGTQEPWRGNGHIRLVQSGIIS
jgi:hypothetical protein